MVYRSRQSYLRREWRREVREVDLLLITSGASSLPSPSACVTAVPAALLQVVVIVFFLASLLASLVLISENSPEVHPQFGYPDTTWLDSISTGLAPNPDCGLASEYLLSPVYMKVDVTVAMWDHRVTTSIDSDQMSDGCTMLSDAVSEHIIQIL